MPIKIDVLRCTGCGLCELACSYRRATYVLGICPRFAAKVGMDLAVYAEVIAACSGITKSEEELSDLASSITR